MKTLLAVVRDHSSSMSSVAQAAERDYNANINATRDAAVANSQDVLVSVLELGYGSTDKVRTILSHASVTALKPETRYQTHGYGTPLFDAVHDAIDNLLSAKVDHSDRSIAYMVVVTTDGGENCSYRSSATELAARIRQLQSTDRWTFVFRVPPGTRASICRQLGLFEGNVIEWEGTTRGVERSTVATTQGIGTYFASRSLGTTSTQKFYADLSNVSSTQVASKLLDLSQGIQLFPVSTAEDGAMIKPFFEKRGITYKKGGAFYQLTKSEEVQDYKMILVRDKTTNAVYGGAEARQLLGLPTVGKIRLQPKNLGNFDVFVQSTSVNRVLKAGTNVVYFNAAALR